MIKFVYCVTRKAEVTPEEFTRYWLENHGPLVRSFADTLNARRYVQSHTIPTEWDEMLRHSRAQGKAYDGITEVWWDKIEDLLAALQTPEGQEANRRLAEDENTFVDMDKSCVFLTEEHTIFQDAPNITHQQQVNARRLNQD